MSSLFAAVEMAPRDPILGLNEQFNADPNPAKVNLGVGVYYDENGKLPLLRVRGGGRDSRWPRRPRRAATCRSTASPPTTRRCRASCSAPTAAVPSGRIATVQALGGTGGLKIGADFLKRLKPEAKVLISDPSWENHRALFNKRRLPGRDLPVLRRAPPRRRLRRHAGRAEARRRRHDRRAARLLPQPDRLRPHPGAVGAGHRDGQSASWCPSSTWPTRASAKASSRSFLVEHLVEVAALRALHARRAAVGARAALEHARRVLDPALEGVEAALGDADAAGVAVVDEDRRSARSGSGCSSRARRCPSGRTSPTAAAARSSSARRRGACRAASASSRVLRAARARAGTRSPRSRSSSPGRSSSTVSSVDWSRIDFFWYATTRSVHGDAAEVEVEAATPLGAQRLLDRRVRVLLRLRVVVALVRASRRAVRACRSSSRTR